MKSYHIKDEADTSRALINNWDIFFPHLKLIAEKFVVEKNGNQEWKEIDILAFNSAKKRFSIIELKKGKNKSQLQQANEYRKYVQEQIDKIYRRVEKDYEYIVLPPFADLNEAEIILIAELFPDNYPLLIRETPDVILAKYFWIPIDNQNDNLLIDYIYNKPSKGKQKIFCTIPLKSLERKSEYKKPKSAFQVIKVKFSDGVVIEEKHAMNSFIEAVKKMGIEKARSTNVSFGNIPLFIDKLGQSESSRKKNYTKIGGCYIYKHHSTESKVKLLNKISDKLQTNIQIEIVEAAANINATERQRIKRKKERLLSKIIKLTETELAEFSDEEKKIIIDKLQRTSR